MRSRLFVTIAAGTLVVAIGGAGFVYYRSKIQTSTAPAPTPSVPAPEQDLDLKRYSDLTSLKLGLGAYLASKKEYPATLDLLAPSFVTEVPKDPGTGEPYAYERIDAAYRITFTLDKGILSLSPGPHTMTPLGYDVAVAAPPVVAAPERPTVIETEGVVLPPASTTSPSSPLPAEPTDDTDNDGIPDDAERGRFGTDPTMPDTDGDSFGDLEEVRAGYDPVRKDARLEDADKDGLADVYENYLGTDPMNTDTDGDGTIDRDEVLIYGTDPTTADTDGDGASDTKEIGEGNDPKGPGAISAEAAATYAAQKNTYVR